MAFDFVSYIGQQVEQAYPNIFAEEGKSRRSFFISHLVSIHLLQLIDEKQNAAPVYQFITDKNAAWLKELVDHKIADNDLIQLYFQPINSKLNEANEKISTLIINELHQLDLNANLGESGIYELLTGQTPWIQTHCESWIWNSSDQDQSHPVLIPTDHDSPPEFKDVLKEFNQAVLQQTQHNTVDHHVNTVESTDTIFIKPIFYIINPLIAALIIAFLFCTISK